ncbi:MAG TPA: HEAT repeat domain-containing protein [Longimicrobium sp.]|uniref:HEAT repeat domain-containing protein n=1 Tax=Longimicrobium sp. TaxID=2029185 RepID=UPI002ED80BAB
MSDPAWAEELAALLTAGRGGDAAERALAAAADERTWVRERALAALARLPHARLLLPALEGALRDGADAGRRNAARSILAALAAPGALAGARRALDRLVRHDADPDVRLLAASALGECANPEARAGLEAALDDADANVAAAAADALGSLGDPRSVEALAAVVAGGDPWRALAAVFALGRIGAARALPALAAATADPLLAGAAVEAIGELGEPAGLDALRGPALSGDAELRRAALAAAAGLLPGSPPPTPEWLREAARADADELAARFAGAEADAAAAVLLGAAGTEDAAALLADAMGDPERGPAAAGALGLLPPEVALAVLLPRIEAADAGAREELVAALPPLPDRAAATRVAALLDDEDPEVRATVAEALGRAAPEAEVRALLADALAEPGRRAGAALALGRLSGGACELLIPLLEDPSPETRRAAAEGIARCPGEGVAAAVAAALARETDPAAIRSLAAALAVTGRERAVGPLSVLARGDDAGARFAAVRALGRTGAADALDMLLQVLGDAADPGLQAAALQALGELGDPRAADAVAARIEGDDRDLRRVAAIALRRIAPAEAAERLVRALADRDWRVRLAAARTLERVHAPGADAALHAAAEYDADPLVRRAAARALAVARTAGA